MSSFFQRAMFWTLPPSILVVPLWLVCGRRLFGVPLSFTAGLLLVTGAPVLVLYHTAVLIIAIVKNNKRTGLSSWKDYHLSEHACIVLCLYFAAHLVSQLFVNDGGEWGSQGSAVERWFGWSDDLCNLLCLALLIVIVVLAIAFFAVLTFGRLSETNTEGDDPETPLIVRALE